MDVLRNKYPIKNVQSLKTDRAGLATIFDVEIRDYAAMRQRINPPGMPGIDRFSTRNKYLFQMFLTKNISIFSGRCLSAGLSFLKLVLDVSFVVKSAFKPYKVKSQQTCFETNNFCRVTNKS